MPVMSKHPRRLKSRWRLKEVLRWKKWSVEFFARKAGFWESHAYALAAGRKIPSWETAIRIAKALGVSLDILAGLRPLKELPGLVEPPLPHVPDHAAEEN